MSLERIKEAAEKIVNRIPATKGRGEEATKQALVMPMIAALGYDIWDPVEVCPEYEADFAIKKGGQKEKVDIAISNNGNPVIFIETKSSDMSLDGHHGQLSRYFNSVQSVALGILTNGVEWRFFTDTAEMNIMDALPFHVSKLDSTTDQGLEVMTRFMKGQPFVETVRDYATDLLYTAKIAAFLRNEIDLKERDPSEYFVRWILKGEDANRNTIHVGTVTMNTVTRFQPIVKSALARVNREIARRSITVFDNEVAQEPESPSVQAVPPSPSPGDQGAGQDSQTSASVRREIVTTADELALFGKVKAIFHASPYAAATVREPSRRQSVPVEIGYKDTTIYFGIYINKPSWWLIRAYVESATNKWIGFDIPIEKARGLLPAGFTLLPPSTMAAVRVAVASVEDIEKLSPLVIEAARHEIAKHQTDDITRENAQESTQDTKPTDSDAPPSA